MAANNENLSVVAKPGDKDLGLDIDGVTINGVILADSEIWICATGGFGQWQNENGSTALFEPGDETSSVETLELVAGWPNGDADFIQAVCRRLCNWRAEASQFEGGGASEGKTNTIIEHNQCWLPLPRGGTRR